MSIGPSVIFCVPPSLFLNPLKFSVIYARKNNLYSLIMSNIHPLCHSEEREKKYLKPITLVILMTNPNELEEFWVIRTSVEPKKLKCKKFFRNLPNYYLCTPAIVSQKCDCDSPLNIIKRTRQSALLKKKPDVSLPLSLKLCMQIIWVLLGTNFLFQFLFLQGREVFVLMLTK